MECINPIIIKKMATFEPVSLSSKTYDELVIIVRQSFRDACILYIDKIINPVLLLAFEQRKADFLLKGVDPNEQQLFHGTKSHSVKSICDNGYKAVLNKVSAFGKGTYFSSAGSYSKNFADTTGHEESFMFVNRVLLGAKTTSVNRTYTGDSGGDGDTIFVCKYDDACLPEYVICFHKNARV